jgi:hypothetical protein
MELNDKTSFPGRGKNPFSYFMENLEGLIACLHVEANRISSAIDINGPRFLVRPARNVVTILKMLRQNSHCVSKIQYFRWWNSGGG